MLGFHIGKRRIGPDSPVFIVAEISANHGQKFDRAVAMIKKAKECGADAIKFQTYTPDTITIDADNRYFRIKHPQWGGQTLYQLYGKGYTPWGWFKRLKRVCDNLGIIFFSTAFDKTSVDFLEELHVPAHKISSFEIVDLPLIAHAARTRKPLILSTGMASSREIRDAVSTARKAGGRDILLLKCVSHYPADPREMNLKTIPDMMTRFRCPVGLSDHTLQNSVAFCAVSLGAVMIEKHFTLSRRMKSPDGFFSIGPRELKGLVKDVRDVQAAMGQVHYGMTKKEKAMNGFRRSLFVVKNIKAGEKLSQDNIRSIRPAAGLSPKYLGTVLGRKARQDIKAGTPLDWPHVTKR